MSQQTQDTSHQDQNRPMLAETTSAQEEQRASGQALPILPGDPDYEAARRVWNGAYDLHPALIVSSNQDLTYREFVSKVNRVANSLDKLGIGEGDHIDQGRR